MSRDYGLEDRVTLHRGDLFKPLGGKRYDLIISNPPYVDAEGMADLPRECRAEPKLAFDGGADGLDIVRRILDEAEAASDAAGRAVVRDRPLPAGTRGGLSATAAALARYRGVRGRSVLDRRRRSLMPAYLSPPDQYHGPLAFLFARRS